MKAFIYSGGDIYPEKISERPSNDDLIIAADSGYNHAISLGIVPNIYIGDFDSVKGGLDQETEAVRLPAEKDTTDTQSAFELAIEKGASEIIIIGGIGTRIDHSLSTLAILEDAFERKIFCTVVNGKNRVRYIKNTSTLIGRSQYKYISVIAADPLVKGVSIEGCKYPMKSGKLERRFQFAVSNEIDGNCCLISVKKGGIFIIESSD